jgi:hypothetical protein
MSDMTLKADQERPGHTQPSDIVWAVSYVIVTILLGPSVGKRSGVRPAGSWCECPAQSHA